MGWSFPWVSSRDSDFNFDFGVSAPEEQISPLLEGGVPPVVERLAAGAQPGRGEAAAEVGVIRCSFVRRLTGTWQGIPAGMARLGAPVPARDELSFPRWPPLRGAGDGQFAFTVTPVGETTPQRR